MDKLLAALLTFQARFLNQDDERGATAVEYGLLVALIAAVIVTVVATLGGQVSAAFTSISSKL